MVEYAASPSYVRLPNFDFDFGSLFIPTHSPPPRFSEMPKKSRKQKTPKAVLKAIQVSQRKRANKKKATANAHGETCYVAYQHANKRSQRLNKQNKSLKVIVDYQYKIASECEDSKQLIVDEEKKIAEINRQIAEIDKKIGGI